MNSETIAKLKELEAKATAGPWEWSKESATDGFGDTYHPNVLVGAENIWVMCGCGGAGATCEDISIEENDKAFIAELRNHARDLIRAAELSDARKMVCEAAMKYRDHSGVMDNGNVVTRKWLLDDLMAALAAIEGGA